MVELRVKAIGQAIEKVVEKTAKKVTLDVVANLKAQPRTTSTGTPVDTGWARNNWIPSIGESVDEPVGDRETDVQSAARAQAEGEAEVLKYNVSRGTIYVSNNVPYISLLNDGHSSQQPAGFVQRSIEKAVTTDQQ